MKNKPYGFIYKTILPDGRFYIGQHKIISQKTLDPTYFGSGVIIKDYIKSKGSIGVIRKILDYGYTFNEMNLLEQKHLTETVLNNSQCINLDHAGKVKNTRTNAVRLKIGKSISQMRQQQPEKWKNATRCGSLNNKSKTYKFISPSNVEYNICGGFKEFCKIYNLSVSTMQKALSEGWIPRRGKCSGWRVECISDGRKTFRDTFNHGITHSGINNPNYKGS